MKHPLATLQAAGRTGRLEPCDLSLAQGSCTVLVGPNGAGKSTLLRLVAGLLAPSSGSAALRGQPAFELTPRERAALVAWLPQLPEIDGHLTTDEAVSLARYRFPETASQRRDVARRLLEERGAGHLLGRELGTLSGGEVQRVLLTALRAQEAPLLLVDEPANHLDPKAQIETYEMLGELWQRGAALCLVTHDIRLCEWLGPADDVLVVGVERGRIEWRLSLADPELAVALERIYGVPFVPRGMAGGLSLAKKEQP